MKDLHFVGEITQKALIVKNDLILLTKDLNDHKWDLPGGRLHKKENPQEGLKRELFEETGLKINIESIYAVEPVVFSDGDDRIMIVYKCSVEGSDKLTLQEDEIGDAVWVSQKNYLDYPLYPEFKALLDKFFNQI